MQDIERKKITGIYLLSTLCSVLCFSFLILAWDKSSKVDGVALYCADGKMELSKGIYISQDHWVRKLQIPI